MGAVGGWGLEGDFSERLPDELVAGRVISGEVPAELSSITDKQGRVFVLMMIR